MLNLVALTPPPPFSAGGVRLSCSRWCTYLCVCVCVRNYLSKFVSIRTRRQERAQQSGGRWKVSFVPNDRLAGVMNLTNYSSLLFVVSRLSLGGGALDGSRFTLSLGRGFGV